MTTTIAHIVPQINASCLILSSDLVGDPVIKKIRMKNSYSTNTRTNSVYSFHTDSSMTISYYYG